MIRPVRNDAPTPTTGPNADAEAPEGFDLLLADIVAVDAPVGAAAGDRGRQELREGRPGRSAGDAAASGEGSEAPHAGASDASMAEELPGDGSGIRRHATTIAPESAARAVMTGVERGAVGAHLAALSTEPRAPIATSASQPPLLAPDPLAAAASARPPLSATTTNPVEASSLDATTPGDRIAASPSSATPGRVVADAGVEPNPGPASAPVGENAGVSVGSPALASRGTEATSTGIERAGQELARATSPELRQPEAAATVAGSHDPAEPAAARSRIAGSTSVPGPHPNADGERAWPAPDRAAAPVESRSGSAPDGGAEPEADLGGREYAGEPSARGNAASGALAPGSGAASTNQGVESTPAPAWSAGVEVTAEASRAAASREAPAPTAATPLTELPARIEAMAQAGGGTARLRLDPPTLGEIQVEVRIRGDAVAVRLVASEQAARSVLEDGRARLVDALASRSLRMERFDVSGGTNDDLELSGGSADARSGDPGGAERRAEGSSGLASAPGSERGDGVPSGAVHRQSDRPGIVSADRVDLRI